MSAEKFEEQPYYALQGEAVVDARILTVNGLVSPARILEDGGVRDQQKCVPLDERLKHDFVGSDGEDYSGYIALHELHTADGRELAIVKSWHFSHATGLPPSRHSWSAEFNDPEVAKDFWNNWQPYFNGMNFVKDAMAYLKDHPEIQRQAIHIQELGLLKPWYDGEDGDSMLLEKFSTDGERLVRVPAQHPQDERFMTGGVYKVPEPLYGYAAKTSLAAFIVSGRREADSTVIQWSDGTLSTYSDKKLERGDGPVVLVEADLI